MIKPKVDHGTTNVQQGDKGQINCATLSSRNRTRHTRWVVFAVAPLMTVAPSMWGEGSALHEGLEWLGYTAVIACVLGRAWCTIYIGGFKKREIVKQGPYSIVRNPLYDFSFLGVVGIGLLTGSLTWAVLLAIGFMLYYRVTVRREETYLLANFPSSYRGYLEQVPRWVPDFRLWRDTVGATVRPALVARTLRDGALFFIAFPLLEAIDALHHAGFIPSLIVVP